MKVELRGKAPIGTILLLDDQRYDMVRYQPFECADGRIVQQMVWASTCPKCGDAFEAVSPGLGKMPRRRCDSCTAVMANTRVKPGRVSATLTLPDPDCEE